MLVLCILFVTSVWFCIDYPASLEEEIESKFNVGPTQYGLLYTYFALPNSFMPLLGGILFDKLGVRNGLVMFTAIVCVGQGLFMGGGYQMSFAMCLWGRVVFGIGCEAMIVGQSAIISKWFMHFELPFAMSLIVCIPMLGSFIQGAAVPSVFEAGGFGPAFAVGFGLCLMSLAVVIFVAYLDTRADAKDKVILAQYIQAQRLQTSHVSIEEDQETEDGGELVVEERFEIRDLKTFPWQFWSSAAACLFMQIAINNYLVIASRVLQLRYGFTEVQAGWLFPMPYVVSAIASPFLGLFIDKFGMRK